MQTAIASDYYGTSREPEEIKATLKEVAESGITHVHWAHEWAGDYMYSDDEISFIVSALKEYGVGVKGVHASNGWYYQRMEGFYKWLPQAEGRTDVASMDEDLRKKGSALVQNRLKLASAVGTREIVLHLQVPYVKFSDSDFKQKYYNQVFKTLDENEKYATERGVRICIENMVGTPNDIQFEKLDMLFNKYSPDYLGYCCDTGHAYLTDPIDPWSIPNRYVDRLYMIHLNDNHSFPNPGDFSDDPFMSACDEHIVMGDGVVDFDEFAKILAKSPYEFPVVGEFSAHDESNESFLKRSREQMEKFTDKVILARKM